jgi:hypothetical protein
MKPKVLITLLTGTERQHWINPELALVVFHMGRDPRFSVEVATVKNAMPHDVARNHTIKLARDHGFDWLCSFDNDNFLTTGTPLDIIAEAGNRRVIGLTYGHADGQLLPSPNNGGRLEGNFREVPWTGGGGLLVHRAVWEKIPRGPWFVWERGEDTETGDRGTHGCGEDVYFCRLVQKQGFKVWTHRQLAGHYRTTDMTHLACQNTMSK